MHEHISVLISMNTSNSIVWPTWCESRMYLLILVSGHHWRHASACCKTFQLLTRSRTVALGGNWSTVGPRALEPGSPDSSSIASAPVYQMTRASSPT
jgi:hypothetical protein